MRASDGEVPTLLGCGVCGERPHPDCDGFLSGRLALSHASRGEGISSAPLVDIVLDAKQSGRPGGVK
jgi:hypothetical protein